MDEMKQIADWLQNESEEIMKHAMSRRDMAKNGRTVTAEDLRIAKKIAEQMSGRKLPRESVADSRRSADMQDSIAAKMEAEARQLSRWADFLMQRCDEAATTRERGVMDDLPPNFGHCSCGDDSYLCQSCGECWICCDCDEGHAEDAREEKQERER